MSPTSADVRGELRESLRGYFARVSPESEVRRQMATDAGYDKSAWTRAASDVGLAGLGLPESYGGQGGSIVDLAVAFEEAGRSLFCGPLLSTVAMGANLILASGDIHAAEQLLPAITEGRETITVAILERGQRWGDQVCRTRAERVEGGWRVQGEKWYVLDGLTASYAVVLAECTGGTSLFLVDAQQPSVRATLMTTLDETRKQAIMSFDDAPAQLVGELGQAWTAVAVMTDLAIVLLAAEQVGGAQRVLEMAVEYAKQRVQFGRAIGSFQAIKHKCADMLIEIEEAKAAAGFAAKTADEHPADLPSAACVAKVACSESYYRAAAANIQIHGGIGFTWDHPAHLYFKRAKSDQLLMGDSAWHRDRLMTLMRL